MTSTLPPAEGDPGARLINGWRVLLAPSFAAQYTALRNEARRLKQTLPAEEYRQHPTVKLAAAIYRLLTEIVPQDPNRPDFMLRSELAKFRRAKGHGLPPRYRLFWVFSEQAKTIIFLYLNDTTTLRQQGGRNDPYVLFKRLVERGDIGADFAANDAAWQRAQVQSDG